MKTENTYFGKKIKQNLRKTII